MKVTGWDTRSSSTVLHVNWAFVSSFLAEYSRVEEVVDSPVTASTSTEVRMEIPTQETNNPKKSQCANHRNKRQNAIQNSIHATKIKTYHFHQPTEVDCSLAM